jgi:hypothetical protein
MRTTIDLDEELLRTAKAIAESRGQTLSRVITDLAWKALSPDRNDFTTRNGFPVLSVSSGARPVTPEHIAELLDRADSDEVGR